MAQGASDIKLAPGGFRPTQSRDARTRMFHAFITRILFGSASESELGKRPSSSSMICIFRRKKGVWKVWRVLLRPGRAY